MRTCGDLTTRFAARIPASPNGAQVPVDSQVEAAVEMMTLLSGHVVPDKSRDLKERWFVEHCRVSRLSELWLDFGNVADVISSKLRVKRSLGKTTW